MMNINSSTRLTDSLERQLMARAIEEQMRFKPGKALKAFFSELFGKTTREDRTATAGTAQTAN